VIALAIKQKSSLVSPFWQSWRPDALCDASVRCIAKKRRCRLPIDEWRRAGLVCV